MASPILLVADDLATIAAVKRVLGREGYEVVLATSAADAIIAWGHHLPGLVILQPSVESDRGAVVLEELTGHPDAKLLRVVLLGETVPGHAHQVEPLPLDPEHFAQVVKDTLRGPDDAEAWRVTERTRTEVPDAPLPPTMDAWRATAPREPQGPADAMELPDPVAVDTDAGPPPADGALFDDGPSLDDTFDAQRGAEAAAPVEGQLPAPAAPGLDPDLDALEAQVRAEAQRRRAEPPRQPAPPRPVTTPPLPLPDADMGHTGGDEASFADLAPGAPEPTPAPASPTPAAEPEALDDLESLQSAALAEAARRRSASGVRGPAVAEPLAPAESAATFDEQGWTSTGTEEHDDPRLEAERQRALDAAWAASRPPDAELEALESEARAEAERRQLQALELASLADAPPTSPELEALEAEARAEADRRRARSGLRSPSALLAPDVAQVLGRAQRAAEGARAQARDAADAGAQALAQAQDALHRQAEQAEAQLRRERDARAAIEEGLQRTREELENTRRALEREQGQRQREFEASLDQVRTEADAVRLAMGRELEARHEAAQRRLDEVEQALTHREAKLHEAVLALHAADERATTLEESLEAERARAQGLEQQLGQTSSATAQQLAALEAERDAKLSAAVDELQATQARLTALETDRDAQLSAAVDELQAAQARLTALETDRDAQRSALTEAQAHLAERDATLASAVEELQAAQARLGTLEGDRDAALSETVRELEAAQERLAALQADHDAKLGEAARTLATARDAALREAHRAEELAAALASAQVNLAALEAERDAERDAARREAQRAHELTAALATAKAREQALQSEVARGAAERLAQNAVLLQAQATRDDAERRHEASRRELSARDEALDEAHRELAAARAGLASTLDSAQAAETARAAMALSAAEAHAALETERTARAQTEAALTQARDEALLHGDAAAEANALLAEARATRAALEEERETLRARLVDAEQTEHEATAKLADAMLELESARAQLGEKAGRLEDAIERRAELEQSLSSARSAHARALDGAQADHQALRGELDTQVGLTSRAEAERDALHQMTEALRADVELTAGRLANLQREHEALKATHQEQGRASEHLTTQLAELTSARDEAVRAREAFEGELARVSAELEASRSRATEHEAARDQARLRADELHDELESARDEVTRVTAAMAEVEDRATREREELAREQANLVGELRVQLESGTRDAADALAGALGQAREELRAAQAAHAAEVARLRDEAAARALESEAHEQAARDLQASVRANHATELARLAGEHEAARAQWEGRLAEATSLMITRETDHATALAGARAELEQRAHLSAADAQRLADELATAQARSQALTAELEASRASLERLTVEVAQARLEASDARVRAQAADVKEKVADARARELELRAVLPLSLPGRPAAAVERLGEVDLQGLARLVTQLVLAEASTRLELGVAGGSRSLWLTGGQLSGAESTFEHEGLVARARRDGLIDARQEAELRAMRHATPGEQLQALKARGFIRDVEAVPLVQRYAEQVALEALGEGRTRYRLADEAPGPGAVSVTVPRPTLPVLAEALKRAVGVDALLEALGGGEAVARPGPQSRGLDLRALGFSERERAMLGWVDGEASVEDLVLASGLKHDVALRALHVALLLGALEVTVPQARPPAPSPELEVRRLEAKYDEVQDADYFSILALPRSATSDDVRRAYERLAQEFDPLKFSGHPDAGLQQRAQVVLRLLEEAARALEDERRRADYARHLLD